MRRTAGVSQLINTWSAGDPLDRLLGDLEAAEHATNPTLLASRWQARAEDDGFWATHHDFDRPLAAPQPWLVGAGRAGEVVVNVLLPFAYALGQATAEQALSERALTLYRATPLDLRIGSSARWRSRLAGRGPRLARGACRQQGLIHLYRHWCDSRDCSDCSTRTSAEADLPGCALSATTQSLPRRPPTWTGAAPGSKLWARKRCWSSGTMPPGTSDRAVRTGSALTIAAQALGLPRASSTSGSSTGAAGPDRQPGRRARGAALDTRTVAALAQLPPGHGGAASRQPAVEPRLGRPRTRHQIGAVEGTQVARRKAELGQSPATPRRASFASVSSMSRRSRISMPAGLRT